ncbi:MAG: short-chain dehydrogenase [Oceanospirillaceae bacterium]|nr:short-chain dehydrogenase [Oceanospirillaceae bacterium]|tara:strand:+ start:3154 stop:3894 length:741 start_codon:yes stop_codon:yes gene_type:complete
MQQILVTGGTSGIGLATAQQLKNAGHQVLITGRSQGNLDRALDQLNQSQGAEVNGLMCDQSQPEQIQALAEELIQSDVQLNSLVLNAGIFLPQMFDDMTLDNLNGHMATNVTGPLMMIQALLPIMKTPSSVVFISSIAVEKGFATAVAYSASKAAFEGAMAALNLELAERGIRVNCVRPGVTLTDIQRKAGMDDAAIAGLKQAMGQTPAGDMLGPDDIAPAICHLALEGSRHSRNARITVDGGYCL